MGSSLSHVNRCVSACSWIGSSPPKDDGSCWGILDAQHYPMPAPGRTDPGSMASSHHWGYHGECTSDLTGHELVDRCLWGCWSPRSPRRDALPYHHPMLHVRHTLLLLVVSLRRLHVPTPRHSPWWSASASWKERKCLVAHAVVSTCSAAELRKPSQKPLPIGCYPVSYFSIQTKGTWDGTLSRIRSPRPPP
jgi:hypothetical protein